MYADIRGVSLDGAYDSGVDDDGNFGNLGGYFFGNFRDKASYIIWRYFTSCRLAFPCKMNELE